LDLSRGGVWLYRSHHIETLSAPFSHLGLLASRGEHAGIVQEIRENPTDHSDEAAYKYSTSEM